MPAVALTSEGAGQCPPVTGYANRTIMLDSPELSEEGDKVHVVIRNARTMTSEELAMTDACSAPSERHCRAPQPLQLGGLLWRQFFR